MILSMAEAANFSLDLHPTRDGTFGAKLPNGSWSGTIGMVVDGETDFSISDLSVTEERSEAVTFTVGITQSVNKLFMIRQGLGYKWTTFVDVFDPMFWTSALVTILCSAIFLSLLYNFAPREQDIGVTNAIGMSLASFTALGVDNFPQRIPGRILVLSILITGSLCYWSYKGSLVSHLSVLIFTFPITSLEDVLHKEGYNLVIEDGTAYIDFFQAATKEENRVAHELWNSRIQYKTEYLIKDVPSIESILLKDPKAVYFGPELHTKVSMPRYPCKIVDTSGPYFSVSLSWAFQKNSPYLPLFNFLLGQAKESGLDQKLIKAALDSKVNLDCDTVEASFSSISYREIFTAFFILGIGAALSLGMAIIENLSEKRRMWNKDD